MSIDLPLKVYEAVAHHLRAVGQRAPRKWEINQTNEDSHTGAAFAELQTYRTRRVNIDGREWRWRVRACKFGSGGKNSQEKRMGADGIIEIEVVHHATGNIDRKSLLVQAKKEWSGADSRLLKQVTKMEALAEGSSAAIDYSPRGYSGVNGHDVLVAEGNRNRLADDALTPLGNFLADRFLACQIGVKGL